MVSVHPNERKVLEILRKFGKLKENEVVEKSDLNKDSTLKALGWARTKGLVKVEETSQTFMSLTNEGLTYSKDGLPEKRLIKILKMEELSVEEAKKKVPNFNVAIVWARKNGWVEIEKGVLKLTEKGKKAIEKRSELEVVLEKLAKEKVPVSSLSKEVVDVLKKRKLAEEEVVVERSYEITKLGEEVLEQPFEEVITQITPQILKEGSWKGKKFQKYDVKLPTPKVYPGKRHFLQYMLEYVKQVWIEMGFKEMTGPLVEVSFWNFDALFQPQDHPARDLADTLYVKVPKEGELPSKEIVEAVKQTHENGWKTGSKGWGYKWNEDFAKKLVFRTHTTALSARTLAKLRKDVKDGALPAKYFAVGRVFRNETLDWKHLIEFHQTEGIVVAKDVNFKHLLGYLKLFFEKLGFEKIRFRPAYFPYTEMSVEPEVWHPVHKEWVELGGAGIFRPEVVEPLLGKDVTVLAWGLGLERPVMLAHGIKDIRELYWNDLELLRRVKIL